MPELSIAFSPDFEIEYPKYISKDQTPFAVRLCYENLEYGANYGLRGCIGGVNASKCANKIWDGNSWYGRGDWVAFDITTNSSGQWCGIVYMKVFNSDSSNSFEDIIQGNETAWISLSIRNYTEKDPKKKYSDWNSKEVSLLDIGEEVFGGITAGWIEGFYPDMEDETLVKLKDGDELIAFYTLENNNVTDTHVFDNEALENMNDTGYFNLPAPEGNYTLEFSSKNGTVLREENISVMEYVEYSTTYTGFVYYLLISSTIGAYDLENDIYEISANQVYDLFEVENLEYLKILNQNLNDILEMEFWWNVSNSSDLIYNKSIAAGFSEIIDLAEWTAEAGNYIVCGSIINAHFNGKKIYNIAQKWAAPEEDYYGNAFCIDLVAPVIEKEISCSTSLKIDLEQEEFETGDIVPFILKISSSTSEKPLVRWWVEKTDGKKVKSRYFKTDVNSSGNEIEESWETNKNSGNFILKANLTGQKCGAYGHKNITIAPKDDYSFSVYPQNDAYNAGDNLLIKGELLNGYSENKNVGIEIEAKRVESILGYQWVVADESAILPAKETTLKEWTWKLPDDAITGRYRIKTKFSHEKNKYQYSDFYVNGSQDLGEPLFEIVSVQEPVRFGDFTYAVARYFAGNYNGTLRFISYIDSPKHVSIDLKRKTIYDKYCEKDTAIEQNFERGDNATISLPIFLKDNCDNDYSNGVYASIARICQLSGKEWDYMPPSSMFKKSFSFEVSGNNNELCAESSSKSSSGGGGGSSVSTSTSKSSKSKTSKLVFVTSENITKEMYEGSEILSVVSIKNDYKTKKKFDIYSYVYSGSKLASEGGWTANKIMIELEAGKSRKIELKNKIKKDVRGEYSLKIRVNDGEKNYDSVEKIQILPLAEGMELESDVSEVKEERLEKEVEGLEEIWEAREAPSGITGLAIAKESGKNGFISNFTKTVSESFTGFFESFKKFFDDLFS